MLRNDVFRAATCIAQTIYTTSVPQHALSGNSTRPPDYAGPDNPLKYPIPAAETPLVLPPSTYLSTDTSIGDNFILSSLRSSTSSLVEKALEIFEQKMMRLGTGYMEYWLMSAAYGLIPSSNPSTSADDLRSRGKNAIEKMTRLCYKILALQENLAAGVEPQSVAERAIPRTGAGPDALMEGEALGMGVMSLDSVSSVRIPSRNRGAVHNMSGPALTQCAGDADALC
jgi:hypothetical protein